MLVSSLINSCFIQMMLMLREAATQAEMTALMEDTDKEHAQ